MRPPAPTRLRLALPPLREERASRGFALLITITLLAFLVLLLVSLASLTRVETQVAANNQQLSQARQNALLGLNIALGRLQQLAGPDQRVTGTADLVNGRQDAKKHWTGVWDSAFDVDPAAASFQTPRGWLVSGTAATGPGGVTSALAAGGGNQLVTLIGDNTADVTNVPANRVQVETQPVKTISVPGLPDSTTGGHTIGSFAYWVGDEGVKAKATLVDPYADPAHDQHRFSLIAALRNGLERIETAADESPVSPSPLATAYPANDDRLTRIVSLAQLPFASPDPTAQPRLRTVARTRFHDLTATSASVLADVARGGLKKDLTQWLRAAPADAPKDTDLIYAPSSGDTYGLPRWGLIRSYAGIADDGAAKSPQALVNTATEVRHGLHPVVTYFRLGLNISCAGDGAPLVVHLFPTLVLWNPYNVPIAATAYEFAFATSDASAQMRWRVSEKDSAQVELNTGRVLAYLNFNRTTLNGTGSAGQYWRFPVAATEIPPGRSLVFTLGATAPYTAGQNALVNAADGGDSVTFTGDTVSAPELAQGVFWDRNTWAGGNLYAVLRTAPAAGAAAPSGTGLLDGALHSIQRVGYGSPGTYTTDVVPASPPLVPAAQLRIIAAMGSSGGIKHRWIAQQNLRAPLALRPAVDGSVNSSYYGDYTKSSGQPTFDGARASAGYSVTGASAVDFVLAGFQPADTPLFSLAQLQHASLSLLNVYPAYAVGNSLADAHIDLGQPTGSPDGSAGHASGLSGDIQLLYDLSYLLNRELWDRTFFSTLPDTLSADQVAAADFHLPNARHVFQRPTGAIDLADLTGPAAYHRAAAHLLVDGGFNVNSTSYQAWRAVLSAHLGLATDGVRRHPFARLFPLAGTPNQLWSGHRVLSDEQIDRLAWNIVQEVKRRGPFLSLADFVNRRRLNDAAQVDGYKGPLQAAIDTTDTETAAPAGPPRAPINTDAALLNPSYLVSSSKDSSVNPSYDQQRFQGGPDRAAPYSSRLAFAPGCLTQADLLTALGPVLAARSDTFLIRAYGDVQNPVTGQTVEGTARCEAVVQRLPAYVESAVNPWDTPPAGGAGETFGRRFQIISFRWLTPVDL